MRNFLLLLITCFIPASCSVKQWEKSADGVIIRLKDKSPGAARILKIEPVSDWIIHVAASPERSLSDVKSLCVTVQQEPGPDFDVSEKGDSLLITTSKIKAMVSLANGAITFRDENGKMLLRESERGGKSFKSISVEGTDGYSIRQIFDSPADEAFYGLGQHQSDEFNYKGLNESLYQYNTKVSVPFVVSGKNYGILWDNYSLTKFGDPRDYSQIDMFRLYDDEGKEGALTVTYYDLADTSRVFLEKREARIDFENLETIKNLPADVHLARSKVIWSGELEPSESGLYHFKLYYAGYTKLYLDNEPVVSERWRTAWNPNTYKFSRQLEKGKRYSVRLEWKPDGNVSYIGLKALSPLSPEEQGSLSLWSEMGEIGRASCRERV